MAENDFFRALKEEKERREKEGRPIVFTDDVWKKKMEIEKNILKFSSEYFPFNIVNQLLIIIYAYLVNFVPIYSFFSSDLFKHNLTL